MHAISKFLNEIQLFGKEQWNIIKIKNKYIDLLILLLCSKISLNDIERLLIDLNVLVGLQELDLVEAEDLLDDDGVGVGGPGLLGLLLTQPKDVLQPVQGHLG